MEAGDPFLDLDADYVMVQREPEYEAESLKNNRVAEEQLRPPGGPIGLGPSDETLQFTLTKAATMFHDHVNMDMVFGDALDISFLIVDVVWAGLLCHIIQFQLDSKIPLIFKQLLSDIVINPKN
ncbi:hypothetical protein TWF718_010839 [Orbilia javanica]|uniref:Uncharacterized protein n=1 Tax=Orbilia javanica TaxID=47235 RepID=A0AAN8R962_9PEZI